MLQKEASKASSSSSAHLRNKLMAAVDAMQSAVGVKDLGLLHYELIRDAQNCVMFVAVNHMTECRSTPSVSLRWTKLTKLYKRQVMNNEDTSDGMKQIMTTMPVSRCSHVPSVLPHKLEFCRVCSTLTRIDRQQCHQASIFAI
jgi:hypothetical protein